MWRLPHPLVWWVLLSHRRRHLVGPIGRLRYVFLSGPQLVGAEVSGNGPRRRPRVSIQRPLTRQPAARQTQVPLVLRRLPRRLLHAVLRPSQSLATGGRASRVVQRPGPARWRRLLATPSTRAAEGRATARAVTQRPVGNRRHGGRRRHDWKVHGVGRTQLQPKQLS